MGGKPLAPSPNVDRPANWVPHPFHCVTVKWVGNHWPQLPIRKGAPDGGATKIDPGEARGTATQNHNPALEGQMNTPAANLNLAL
jgi:hypothetical protein